MRRVGLWLRDVWMMVGIAAVALVLLECGLTVVFDIRDRMTWRPPDERFNADTYLGAAWPYDYYLEHASIAETWKPYVYWRRHAYHGRFINVEESGHRRTTSNATQPDALKIFMFGGSTMWGTGARDEYTIPSLVARELKNHGIASNVANFGESGYVSSQSVEALEQALRAGERPDLVIQYDGINDVYSAYQQRVAGWPQNESNRFREFKPSLRQRTRDVLDDYARDLSTRRFLGHFWPFSRLPAFQQAARNNAAIGIAAATNDDQLAGGAVDVFMTNTQIVKALGARYGFDALFYWQPTILDKGHVTAYEQTYRTQMEAMAAFFRRASEAVRRETPDPTGSFHDISRIFADTTGPVFVDYFHLGEVGDEMVAKTIVPDVVKLIAERHLLPKRSATEATQ